jgi:hypothetical protein
MPLQFLLLTFQENLVYTFVIPKKIAMKIGRTTRYAGIPDEKTFPIECSPKER